MLFPLSITFYHTKKENSIEQIEFSTFSTGIIYSSHHPEAINISQPGSFIIRTTWKRLTFTFELLQCICIIQHFNVIVNVANVIICIQCLFTNILFFYFIYNF